jgi:WhiB family redox-sensing transcriptional regulator
LLLDLEWQDSAKCAGSDVQMFYPDEDQYRSDPHGATLICMECPVRHACLETAMERGEKFGIWGGMTPRERANLRIKRNNRAQRLHLRIGA